MLDCPFQFLHRNQNLSQRCVDFGLPRVKTCYRSYGLLMIKDISVEGSGSIVWLLSPLICVMVMYFSRVFKTLLLCLNVVFDHSFCAFLALPIALSIPSGVEGFTKPSRRPLDGQ